MKVLYFIDALGEGGTEMSLAELLPPLRSRGVEPTLVCLRSRGTEGVQPSLVEQGFDVRVLEPGRYVSQVRQAAHLAREVNPDLVHTMLFRSNIVGRAAGARTRTPVLSSLVNTSYVSARMDDPRISRSRMRLVQGVDAFTARHFTAALHAVSDAVRDHAIATLRVDPARVSVIRRGRDPARLGEPSPERTARAREMLGIPADAMVVVHVGRQEFQKGHETLIDASALLGDEFPDVVVLSAGREGRASDNVRARAASRELGDRLRFLGHRSDVPEVLAAGDVFVFPSRYEGLPGAVVEAMALALPVVASDIPPVRETVRAGENALLVPVDDAAELAAGVATLLRDPDARRRFGAVSRQRFLDEFLLERSVDQMLGLYQQVVSAGSQ